MTKAIDMVGQKHGRLSVIRSAGASSEGRRLWYCKCDCGSYATVLGKKLREGSTKSCGCLRKEVLLNRQPKRELAKASMLISEDNRF